MFNRPVTGLIEIEINKVIPNKLKDVLNQVLYSHGTFQMVLIVTTHNNTMNSQVKNEIFELFSKYKSICFTKCIDTKIYFTFTESKFAYEALAEFNNYYFEVYNLHLKIEVEDEETIANLVEEELKDCLSSISKTHIETHAKSPDEIRNHVEVAELVFKNLFLIHFYFKVKKKRIQHLSFLFYIFYIK
jgi:hypothetical protein